MPSSTNQEKMYPLVRSNAVWDLSSIPPETPLHVELVLEIHAMNESPMTFSATFSSLDRVLQLSKFLKGLISHESMEFTIHDQVMDECDYLYEYNLVDQDIIKVFYK